MSTGSWKLADEKRWHISVVLETVTPLHVGCGELCTHKDIVNESSGGKFVDINACIKGKYNLPLIPGSTTKGKFYQWLKEKSVDADVLGSLFGKGHNGETGDQGRGGKAQFHDARITQQLSGDQPWPYWCEDKQTYIEASTAIDRHRRTALSQTLHYTETVPPGVGFKFIISGVMSELEAALLIATLDSFYKDESKPCFGANDANGFGRMKLYGHLQVKKMGAEEIANWLAGLKANDKMMAMESIDYLPQSEITYLIEQGRKLFQSNDDEEERIDLTLKFDGPFLVNDPFTVNILSDDETTKTDYYPLLDDKKLPYLPVSSFRGALRSQAERIIRTLGGKCCDTASPCRPIYKKSDLNQLCLACQIFGATGWKTVLKIHPFTLSNPEKMNIKKQEFVAIDRFHGGGKDGAKFDAAHFEHPEFKGKITFSPRMKKHELNWGKGLLALVLRDIQEGDVTFGFGANKGYGRLEDMVIKGFTQQTESITAFRNKCLEFAHAWNCDAAEIPKPQERKTPLAEVAQASNNNHFHNPYHFIPTGTPNTAHWTNEAALNANSHHSHGFYRDQTDDGEQLYHGRIVCRLATETPTFIGAGEDNEPIEAQEESPKLLKNYRLNGEIAIPATSLRGMVSSLAETASNSAMRVLDNGLLSYRKPAGDTLREIGMVIEKDNKIFVIPIERMSRITSLKYAYPKARKSNPAMEKFIKNKQSWSLQHNNVYYLPEDPGTDSIPQELFVEGSQPGILRILGKEGRTKELENKTNELFIPVPSKYIDIHTNCLNVENYIKDNLSKAKQIPAEVVTRYTELADQRSLSQKSDKDLKNDKACQSLRWLPFHLKGAEREYDSEKKICKLPIKAYDLIYFNEKKGIVTEISFSSIWRGRVESSASQADRVSDFIPDDLLPFDKTFNQTSRKKVSPTELLFGFTELDEKGNKSEESTRAFAGKVRISAGLIPEYPKDDAGLLEDKITLKALSTPKPPSPALYFKPKTGSGYIHKKDLKKADDTIKGRKYYLHAMRNENRQDIQKLNANGATINAGPGQSKFPWETFDETDNPQLKVRIKPIKKDQAFYFHLDFNNLTEWELGLLCYALRPTDNFRHRIGMGKPIGLGSVKIDIAALHTIHRHKRYGQDATSELRFNQHSWIDKVYKDELQKEGYHTNETTDPLVPEVLREIFTTTMNADIYRALDLLGDPQNVKHPVHYPQVTGCEIEQENYKWFVANDQGSGTGRNKISAVEEILKDIVETENQLPTLARHPWRG